MAASLELSRWRAAPKGIAYRRWVIVETGLRQLLATRFFRWLLGVAWAAGLAVAAAGFLFSQSVSAGGWIETWAAHFGPRVQAVASAFCAMILLYPDICITGVHSVILWAHSHIGLGLSLVALTVVIPRLIARDRAGQALTIYLSRPLTSTDYLVGKLGIVVGILLLLWTGPLLAGWLLGVLFAPGTDFLHYSLAPVAHALLFNAAALAVLAAVALGVSSLARSTRSTIILWVGVWIIAGWVAAFPASPDWLRYASFSFDLEQTRRAVFGLSEILTGAARELPLLNPSLTRNLAKAGQLAEANHLAGALAGLSALIGLSCAALLRRLRPE